MIPIPTIPNPTLILGVVLAFVISTGLAFGIGHHQGYKAEHQNFLNYQDKVRAEGEIAEAKNKALVANHEAVTAKISADSDSKLAVLKTKADAALKTQQAAHEAVQTQVKKDVQNAYENKIAAIHAAYAGRLLGVSTNPSGSNLSTFSLSTPAAYDKSSYDLLAANCAITTQMLLSLQEWVAAERAVQ